MLQMPQDLSFQLDSVLQQETAPPDSVDIRMYHGRPLSAGGSKAWREATSTSQSGQDLGHLSSVTVLERIPEDDDAPHVSDRIIDYLPIWLMPPLK
jgi:hypothetical protein